MVNFHHRFIPNGTKIQQPLTELLEGHKRNSKKPLLWTESQISKSFTQLNEALYKVTFLAHPVPDAALSLVTDASDTFVGVSSNKKWKK
ncbi:hypothetical protein AVEN_206656-1 [Araneus ventricosus]|uniref:Reverse transcriptase/retrotransposon-derived protein RNase H-like domain-containing protein n=1 Tax=Araneus ventricosus TaxID=182803 RepID=A0A4Y2H5H3_ARAVE|nr:hypothetical protein AVEN_206656-1 [Araneus ventricosus]